MAGGTPVRLTIDGAGSATEESFLPRSIRGISSLWSNDTLTGITEGDAYDIRVQFVIVDTSSNPQRFTVVLDIGPTPDGTGGAGSILITEESKTPKTGTPQTHIVTFPAFTLATFIANGGTFWVSADSGSVEIETRSILITRTSSGKS